MEKKASKNPTDHTFPIDVAVFDKPQLRSLVALDCTSPHEKAWRGWCTKLPTIHATETHLRASQRVLKIRGELESAKAGLFFVEIVRYEKVVHIRQSILKGSVHQTLRDRVHSSWYLLEAESEAGAENLVQLTLETLSSLVALPSLGIHLETLEILATKDPDFWHFTRDHRDELLYLCRHKIPIDSWSEERLPSRQEVTDDIKKFEYELEVIRGGGDSNPFSPIGFIFPDEVRILRL